MGKGENAGYQHFLLFSQCFQRDSYTGLFKSCDCVVELKGVELTGLTLYNTPQELLQRSFEKIVGKKAIADEQHILLFQQCFLPYRRQISSSEPY